MPKAIVTLPDGSTKTLDFGDHTPTPQDVDDAIGVLKERGMWAAEAAPTPEPTLEGAPDIVTPIYPEQVTTEEGFEAARERPGRVVRFEEGEQITETAPVIPTPGPMRYRAVEPEAPSLVMPTAEEAAAVGAAIPAFVGGVAGGLGMRGVGMEVGPPSAPPVPEPIMEMGAERVEDERALQTQERFLQETLGKDWTDAVAEDFEGLMNMAEVIGHSLNKAMEEAKDTGESPTEAAIRTGAEAGLDFQHMSDKDIQLLVSRPLDYARANPVTTAIMAVPSIKPAAKATALAVKLASEMPAVVKIAKKTKGALKKVREEILIREEAIASGVPLEEFREIKKAVEVAPPRPKVKLPEPEEMVSPKRADVSDKRVSMAEEAIDAPEPMPQAVAYEEFVDAAGNVTDAHRAEIARLKDLYREKPDIQRPLSQKETAAIHVEMTRANTAFEEAVNAANDVIFGRTALDPESPDGKRIIASRMAEASEAKSQYLGISDIDILGSRETARALAMRQNFLTRDYDLISMQALATAKKGSRLTQAQETAVQLLSRRLKSDREIISKMDERVKRLMAEAEASGDIKRVRAAEKKITEMEDAAFAATDRMVRDLSDWEKMQMRLGRYSPSQAAALAASTLFWGRKGADVALHGPKLTRAIWDVSAPLVQGMFSGHGHPYLWLTNVIKHYRPSKMTGRGAWATARELVSDPDFHTARNAGLPLYDMDATSALVLGLNEGDDMFAHGLLSRLGSLNPALSGYFIPSARSHAAFLNGYRLGLFKTMLGLDMPVTGKLTATQKLVNPFRRNYMSEVHDLRARHKAARGKDRPILKEALEKAEDDARATASVMSGYIGAATGHGSTPPALKHFNPGNIFFWSSRMFTASFEHPALVAGMGAARAQRAGLPATKALALQAAMTADALRSTIGMYALMQTIKILDPDAQVGLPTDVTAENWGRIMMGNGTVFDVGGYQGMVVRLMATALNNGAYGWDGEWESVDEMGGYSELVGRFITKKLSPTMGTMKDIISGKDFFGAPVDVLSSLGALLVPLSGEAGLRSFASGDFETKPVSTGAKMMGAKIWEPGEFPEPLSEVPPFSYLPYIEPSEILPNR